MLKVSSRGSRSEYASCILCVTLSKLHNQTRQTEVRINELRIITYLLMYHVSIKYAYILCKQHINAYINTSCTMNFNYKWLFFHNSATCESFFICITKLFFLTNKINKRFQSHKKCKNRNGSSWEHGAAQCMMYFYLAENWVRFSAASLSS